MQQIARIEVQAPPIFGDSYLPDVEGVQINAYQRVVRFRKFLDQTLHGNRFWNVHRRPGWAADFTDFQLVEPRRASE
jgi:hypothetical protein